MSKHAARGRIGSASRTNRTKKPVCFLERRLGFESLEHRRLLSAVAPTSVTFQPQSGQGTSTITSANNSSGPEKLQFIVNDATSGDQVTIYSDGTAIGSVSAGSASPLVTTDSVTTLSNGTHTITATETDSTGISGPSSGLR